MNVVGPERLRKLHPVAAGDSLPVGVPVRQVMRAWDIEPVRIARIGGSRNVHWAVSAPEGRFVLRCYRQDRDAEAIDYEFRVLAHLRQAGWPVACPLPTLATWKERLFALFPALPGRQRPIPTRPAYARERGALLAVLHSDLDRLPLGQRSNWRSTDEFMAAEAGEIVANAMARLGDHPHLREPIVRITEKTYATLDCLPVDLPRCIVHGDFVAWNLRWRDGYLSALLDFDDARLDLRAMDVAAARRRDTDEVVAGYLAVQHLDDLEIALLAPLWRAYTLLFVADLLQAPALTNTVMRSLEWCAQEIQTTQPAAVPRTAAIQRGAS
ncbi:phosphotransferase enzyme family protein [Sphaerisporangium fuscum]|uniref:phosphotransferase enzyme family protein n=1 Tax=Sphaerisporangium fuscum TaxID=2835868 RepID=UPI001BDDC261|nr:phosphotransferase [Sphaerisporangium fuscum]